jgi:hypothetical protein
MDGFVMSDLFEEPIFEEWKDLEIAGEIANQEIREEGEQFPTRISTLGEELESLVLSAKNALDFGFVEPASLEVIGEDNKPLTQAEILRNELFNSKSDSKNALDKVDEFLRKVLILQSDHDYSALTLWIAYCYSITRFTFAPRLCFWSPEKRCGKSLALEVVANLLPNPLMTSSISSAALFRILDKDKSKVILIDESDTVFGRNGDKEKAEALRQLLNASFKTGQVVVRCEPPKLEPKEFSIFAPIALAGIGTTAIPETVADRAIMIEMRRMFPHEKILEFESDEVDEYFLPLKKALEIFARVHESKYAKIKPDLPRESLNPRARDVWKPLYKVAECAGEEWIKKVRSASIALSSGESDSEEASLPLRLLSDIREVLHEDLLSTRDLLERLRGLEEAPWAYMEKFNPSRLAYYLKNYGIKPKPFSGGRIRGYYKKSFEDSWNRYLQPPEPLEAVTPVTPATNSQEEFGWN